MGFKFPFNWYNKFGTIPSEFREAMSYEEQILWLCKSYSELIEQFKVIQVEFEKVQEDYEAVPEWVKNPENETELVETITSQSTDSEIPTAQAVYNLVEGMATGIPVISEDTNIWEFEDFGLYKVEQGVKIYYGTSEILFYTVQNPYAYLYVGYNNGIFNFIIFDKSSVDDKSGAIFCGYTQVTAVSPDTIAIGNCIEQCSNYTNWETKSAKVTEINSSSTNSYYPSAKAVYDYVQTEIGNIETALNNINIGSGV